MVNFLFDFKMYGCIFIKIVYVESFLYLDGDRNIIFLFYNLEVVWFGVKSDDEFRSDIVEVGVGRSVNEFLYFGRILSLNGGILCVVISFGNRR